MTIIMSLSAYTGVGNWNLSAAGTSGSVSVMSLPKSSLTPRRLTGSPFSLSETTLTSSLASSGNVSVMYADICTKSKPKGWSVFGQ